jgi:asparagine synthetase B (glutamine-hydrolysing)
VAELRDLRRGLDHAFEEALRPLRQEAEPLGVLSSAGVDSALLAWELRDRPRIALYTMGRRGSPDLEAGRIGAERLGLPWEGLSIDARVVQEAEGRFSSELEGLPHVVQVVLLSLALAIERAPPAHLVCGQGADELFLGYAHFQHLSAPEAERRSIEDMARLREVDWPRTLRVADRAGKTLVAPYLSRSFEEAVRQVPPDLRLPRGRPPPRGARYL